MVELWCNGASVGRLQIAMELQNTQIPGTFPNAQQNVVNRPVDPPNKPIEPNERQKQIGTLGVTAPNSHQPPRNGNVEQIKTEHYVHTREVSFQLKANYKVTEESKPLLNPALISLPEDFDPLTVDLNSIYEVLGNKAHHQVHQKRAQSPSAPSPTIQPNQ